MPIINSIPLTYGICEDTISNYHAIRAAISFEMAYGCDLSLSDKGI